MAESIDNAKDELRKRPAHEAAVDKALKALDEGTELITTRQKLIRIAARSELGWKVVEEYEADELASSSDVGKNLESREGSGDESGQETKNIYRSRNYPGKFQQNLTGGVGQPGPWFRSQRLQPTPVQPRSNIPVSRPAPALGQCFGYGEMGHLRRFCPKMGPGQVRWYP